MDTMGICGRAPTISIMLLLISSIYGAPPRYVYYLSLGFVLSVLLTLKNSKFLWAAKEHPTSDVLHLLAAAVGASAIIYSATTALHAWILLLDIASNPKVFDMDIIAAQYILVVGLLISEPLGLDKCREEHKGSACCRPVSSCGNYGFFGG